MESIDLVIDQLIDQSINQLNKELVYKRCGGGLGKAKTLISSSFFFCIVCFVLSFFKILLIFFRDMGISGLGDQCSVHTQKNMDSSPVMVNVLCP